MVIVQIPQGENLGVFAIFPIYNHFTFLTDNNTITNVLLFFLYSLGFNVIPPNIFFEI